MQINNDYPNPSDWVIVLGSGASINSLPKNMISWLNKTKVRVAINKYGYFYDKTGILPTDVYFHDFHDLTSEYFFYKTIKKTRNIASTFYVSSATNDFLTKSKASFLFRFWKYLLHTKKKFLIQLIRKLLKPINKKKFNKLKLYLNTLTQRKPILFKKHNAVYYVDVHYLWDDDNIWAKTLEEKLFHFRGSLTSVLNLISIQHPNLNILMLGVDLTSKEYFFDKELKELYKKTGLGYDWSQSFMDDSGKHYSAALDSGVTIFDRFDYVVSCLNKSNNNLFAYPYQNAAIFDGLVKPFKT